MPTEIAKGSITISDIFNGDSCYLSNEAITIPCDEDGSNPVLTGANTTVIVISEGVSVTPTLGVLVTSGCTATKVSSVVTITSVSADSGYVDIPISYNGVSYGNKRFSFSLAKKGDQGLPGLSLDWNLINVAKDSQGRLYKTSPGVDGVWDSRAYTIQGYIGGCFVTFKPSGVTDKFMVGLSKSPSTQSWFNISGAFMFPLLPTSTNAIDYAWFLDNGLPKIYENGVLQYTGTSYSVEDTFAITYDGVNIRYYLDGVVIRTKTINLSAALYADAIFSSISTTYQVQNLFFGPAGGVGPVLDWVQAWDGTATVVGGDKIISPKGYFGTTIPTDANKSTFTGIALGKDILGADPTIGIAAYNLGINTFLLKTDGSAVFGTGTNKITISSSGDVSIPGELLAGNITGVNITVGGSVNSKLLVKNSSGNVVIQGDNTGLTLNSVVNDYTFTTKLSGSGIRLENGQYQGVNLTLGEYDPPYGMFRIVADNFNGIMLSAPNGMIELNGSVLINTYPVKISTNGSYWGYIPTVNTNGTLDIGKYLDFHDTSGDGTNYTARLTVDSTGRLTASGDIAAPTFNGLSIRGPGSGGAWGFIPTVGSDGVLEIGKYIDMHSGSNGGEDYSLRLTASGSTLVLSNDLEIDGALWLVNGGSDGWGVRNLNLSGRSPAIWYTTVYCSGGNTVYVNFPALAAAYIVVVSCNDSATPCRAWYTSNSQIACYTQGTVSGTIHVAVLGWV